MSSVLQYCSDSITNFSVSRWLKCLSVDVDICQDVACLPDILCAPPAYSDLAVLQKWWTLQLVRENCVTKFLKLPMIQQVLNLICRRIRFLHVKKKGRSKGDRQRENNMQTLPNCNWCILTALSFANILTFKAKSLFNKCRLHFFARPLFPCFF